MKNGIIVPQGYRVGLDASILTALQAKVTPARPNLGSLGSVAAAVLTGLAAAAVIVVDFGRNKVSAFYSGASAAVAAVAGADLPPEDVLTITPEDETKPSWVVSIADGNAGALVGTTNPPEVDSPLSMALDAVFGPSPASKTASALVDALDGILSDPAVNSSGLLVVDQAAHTVKLYVRADTDTTSINTLMFGSVDNENWIGVWGVAVVAPNQNARGFYRI